MTCNKLTKWVKDLWFSDDGSYFVTWGVEHFKFWHFDDNGNPIKSAIQDSHDGKEHFAMENQPVDLAKVDSKDFVGVAWKGKNTYTLSRNGKLYVFNKNRKIEKWMDIKTTASFGLSLKDNGLICNCSNGIVRIFKTDTLSHLQTLPKPPYLGGANHIIGVKKEKSESGKKYLYADWIAAEMDENNKRMLAVYSDGMTLIWDINSIEKPKVMRAFISHKSSITGLGSVFLIYFFCLEILSNSTSEITKFATCSTDRTLRFWNFYDYSNSTLQKLVKRNIYCKELEKIIYLSQDFSYFQCNSTEDQNEEWKMMDDTEDETHELKCLMPSPDSSMIACGDGEGNVYVYDIENSEIISDLKCHDQEVTSIDYSPFLDENDDYILASASRDRMIHIYSSGIENNAVNTLEGHSSSIQDLKFAFDPEETDPSKRLKLLSWGADRTIIYRGVESPKSINIYHKEVIKNNKFSSMNVHGDKVVVGLDKLTTVNNINTYDKLYEK